MSQQPELGRAGLEALFPKLAEHIDATPPAARERFLAKAFLLLADAHGGLDTALRCLDDARASAAPGGRGTPALKKAGRGTPALKKAERGTPALKKADRGTPQ